MDKRFLIACLATFVVWMAGSFVVHGALLQADYKGLTSMFRPDADAGRYLPFMLLAHVIMAGAFTWIYARGREAKPWLGQGLRFGLVIALVSAVPTYMIYYAVQPMPGMLVIKQIVFNGALLLVLGVVVAYLYRDAPVG